MGNFSVFKTKAGQIVVLNLSEPNDEGDIKITLYDHHIPPTEAEKIASFKADALCDYLHAMLPILLENLPDDEDVVNLHERIIKEGV